MREPLKISQTDDEAELLIGTQRHSFQGRWISGTPWERFGLYDAYVVVHSDGTVAEVPAHSGELVPGSTEDLTDYIQDQWGNLAHPTAPLTLEIDPTNACLSRDCGTRCFSAAYRRLNPKAQIDGPLIADILTAFAREGGKIVRFDGGGDPLLHCDIRSGALLGKAKQLGLKSALLTSGEMLTSSDLPALADSACYLRVSVNACTDSTRKAFHGNDYSAKSIFDAVERYASLLASKRECAPIGASFLLDTVNFSEMLACARICRTIGIRHFSVRRVLGPQALRPTFTETQLREVERLLQEVSSLTSPSFRVFVPWRPVDEPDLAPRSGSIPATQCWQSTFKTIIEPCTSAPSFRAQLCGRYRGCGIGQAHQLPALFQKESPDTWVHRWRDSFDVYPHSRAELVRFCPSCIDRGFILMVEGILNAVGKKSADFSLLHLKRSR